MSPASGKYAVLLKRAVYATACGSTLETPRIYYAARDPLSRRQLSKADGARHGGRRWEGKTTRGACVDAEDRSAQHPPGLSGEVILYRCVREPEASEVFRRSGVHRGNRGLIVGDVVCRIAASYYLSPDPQTRR